MMRLKLSHQLSGDELKVSPWRVQRQVPSAVVVSLKASLQLSSDESED